MTTAPAPLISITSSDEQRGCHAIVYGPPGNSKTLSSISASAHCPAEFSHLEAAKGWCAPEPVTLSDMLWLKFEPGATIGFAQRNIKAPEIDLSDMPPRSFMAAMREATAAIQQRVKDGTTRVVVSDSASFLGYAVEDVANVTYGNLDGQQFWGKVQQLHREILQPWLRIPCLFIHLFHSEEAKLVVGKSDTAEAQAKAAALRREAGGLADISIRMGGAAKNVYLGASSLTFYSKKGPQVGGGKMQTGYWFTAEDSANKVNAKTRLMVPAVSPADWRTFKDSLGGVI